MAAVTSQESALNIYYEWQPFLRMRYSGIPLNLNCVSLTLTGIYNVCKEITGQSFNTRLLLLFKTGPPFSTSLQRAKRAANRRRSSAKIVKIPRRIKIHF